MVEFVLVAPILIILFVGIADFARVFNAGLIIDAAARDGAEHAAQEYLANPPGDQALTPTERLSVPAPAGASAFYDNLHLDAAKVICAETRQLPNTDFQSGSGNCSTWPAVGVCVHDGQDPGCGGSIAGFASPYPSECSQMNQGWSTSADSGERWVEVRVCYRFTSLLNLPLFSLGDFYLGRTRVFVIPCYFATGFGSCP
jgi:TadE-like protein